MSVPILLLLVHYFSQVFLKDLSKLFYHSVGLWVKRRRSSLHIPNTSHISLNMADLKFLSRNVALLEPRSGIPDCLQNHVLFFSWLGIACIFGHLLNNPSQRQHIDFRHYWHTKGLLSLPLERWPRLLLLQPTSTSYQTLWGLYLLFF